MARPLIARFQLTAATLCLLATPSFAQVESKITSEARSLTHHATSLVAHETGFAGLSNRYRASFERGRTTFVPALGERAPHSYSLSLALESIRRESAPERIAPRGLEAPVPRVDGDTVRYAILPGVEERYEVRPEGLKHSVVLAERPQGTGDLTIQMNLEGNLVPQRGTRLERLDLDSGGFGGVEIGEVIGIDANGRECDGWMNCDGTSLEIVLPHDFVENASYPLIVDPLIGSQFLAGSTTHDLTPAVAYDVTNDVYLFAWEVRLSAAQSSIFLQLFDSDGQRVGATASFGGQSSMRNPKVANINNTDRFLVVWQDDISGNWDIRGRTVDAAGIQSSFSTIRIAGTSEDEVEPDVTGERSLASNNAIVGWSTNPGGALWLAQLDTTNPIPVVATTVMLNPAGASNRNIAMSATIGDDGLFAMAARLNDLTRLNVKFLTRNLTVLASASVYLGGAKVDRFDMDGPGGHVAIAWEQEEPTDPSKHDIHCRGVRFQPSSSSIGGWWPSRVVQEEVGVDETDPAIAFCGTRFALSWVGESQTTAGESSLSMEFLSGTTGETCSPIYSVGNTSGLTVSAPAFATTWAGGDSTSGAGVVVMNEHWPSSSVLDRIRAQRFVEMVGGTITPLGGGCSGGTQTVSGLPAIGNENFVLELSSAPATASSGVLLLAAGTGNVVSVCGVCDLVVTTLAIPVAISAGNASFAAPIPCDGSLAGAAIETQFLSLAPGSTTCSIDGVATSDILQVSLDH